jgi:hypothetical protein
MTETESRYAVVDERGYIIGQLRETPAQLPCARVGGKRFTQV